MSPIIWATFLGKFDNNLVTLAHTANKIKQLSIERHM